MTICYTWRLRNTEAIYDIPGAWFIQSTHSSILVKKSYPQETRWVLAVPWSAHMGSMGCFWAMIRVGLQYMEASSNRGTPNHPF